MLYYFYLFDFMEMDEKYAMVYTGKVKRTFLSKLCYISIFFSGSMTLFSFGGMFLSGWLSDYISMVKGYYNIGRTVFFLFFLTFFVLFGSSLIGAYLMLKLKKSGYWFYLISNLILILLSFFVVMNITNIIFISGSLIFVVLYTLQKKNLR